MYKKFFVFCFILTICSFAVTAQNGEIPNSNVIDSKQLLRDVELLSADDMEGRQIGRAGGAKAREYVWKRFKESGLEPVNGVTLQPFIYVSRDKTEYVGANVLGMIKGKKFPDRFIVVTAHYDHVGIQKGEIYNGADDDASGTAALFAFASYFKKNLTDYSLVFVAFDGEEAGLTGSRKFVSEPPIKLDSIVMNVNIDMIGQNNKNELYASGTYHYPFLKTILEPVAAAAKVKLLFGHDRPEQKSDDWTFQSDHGSFQRQKIPFIYFGVEDHKDYHRPTDDYANLTKEFYVHSVETIVAAIKALDSNAEKILSTRGN